LQKQNESLEWIHWGGRWVEWVSRSEGKGERSPYARQHLGTQRKKVKRKELKASGFFTALGIAERGEVTGKKKKLLTEGWVTDWISKSRKERRARQEQKRH